MESRSRKTRAKLEHQVKYRTPLELASGDRIDVGREDDEYPGWKWCTSDDGREGWVPIELIASNGTVLENYSSRELAVRPGEEVTIDESRHGWLLVRNALGERGWIPESHAEPPEN